MKVHVYKLKCITNLHVGSGDFNYGVVDNEVERDCLTGNPVIHASGIKGALRDAAVKDGNQEVKTIFGDVGENNTAMPGAYKFFDAQLLSRPLRVFGSEAISYISVTTPEIINTFIDTLSVFGIDNLPEKLNISFNGHKFYSDVPNIYIDSDEEASRTVAIPDAAKNTLKAILGENYAVCESLSEFKLPVIARNKLGKNNNLWYEEFVPHDSVFYTMIMCDGDVKLDFSKPVQFGGNASIGYGYTKVEKFGGK